MRELIAANSLLKLKLPGEHVCRYPQPAVDLSGRRAFSSPLGIRVVESHTHRGCLPLHGFPHSVLDCPVAGPVSGQLRARP
jgi:hypothetical protein